MTRRSSALRCHVFFFHVSFRSHHHDEPELIIVLVFFSCVTEPRPRWRRAQFIVIVVSCHLVSFWNHHDVVIMVPCCLVSFWNHGDDELSCRHGFFFQHCKGQSHNNNELWLVVSVVFILFVADPTSTMTRSVSVVIVCACRVTTTTSSRLSSWWFLFLVLQAHGHGFCFL